MHRDEVHGRVRGRRGARLLAIGSGGAIPDVADYRVVVDPDDTFIGTLNEDFAIESSAGDIFQLGNASWRVLRIGPGEVRVADAQGAPPTIPFWLGEAPARSDELSRAVSDLRADVGRLLAAGTETGTRTDRECLSPSVLAELCDWLEAETGVPRDAADQVAAYLADAERLLGVLPTQDTLVVERFLRRVGRHAARAARAVRQPRQQSLGARASQALLSAVQFRAAGRGHRGRAAALAGPAALVPAR